MEISKKYLLTAVTLAMIPACGPHDDITHCPTATSFSGHACDATDKDHPKFMPNVDVTITPKKPMGSCLQTITTKTDDTGAYKVDMIRESDYIITFKNSNGFTDTIEASIKAGINDLKVENPICVPPTGRVKGRFCDQRTGLWVNGGEVYVEIPAGKISKNTNEDGTIDFSFPTGEQTLVVENKDYRKEYQVNITAEGETIVGEESCEPVPTGSISGQICSYYDTATNSGYYIAGTKVFVEMGNFYKETISNADGEFTLTDIPEGDIKVQAVRNRYNTTFNVQVTGNQNNSLPQPQCLDMSRVKIAVITGLHDSYDKILEGLGFKTYENYVDGMERGFGQAINADGSITYIDGKSGNESQSTRYHLEKFLANLNWMEDYDIIYFCSGPYERLDGDNGKVSSNIKLFLQNGGSIFVSDNAYGVIRTSLPNVGRWMGNGTDRAANMGTTIGDYDNPHMVTVADSNLSQALHGTADSTEIPVYFAQESWSVMENASAQPSGTQVLVKGTAKLKDGSSVNDSAMVITAIPFENGGRVTYSNISPGKADNKSTQETKDMLRALFFDL